MPDMIDVFCGAGGLSLGLEVAGFRSVLAVECDADACGTYRASFPHSRVYQGRIEDIDFHRYAGNVALVAGGPPCQPFSVGGHRRGINDRRDMLPEFLRVLSQVQPTAFLMENVPGLVGGAQRAYFGAFLTKVAALGYKAVWGVINAADYGVPQKRRRLVVVGSLSRYPLLPVPTHGLARALPFVTGSRVLDVAETVGEPNNSRITYARNPDLRPSPYDGHLFNGGGRAINPDDLCPTMLASAGGNKTPFLDLLNEVPRYHAELVAGGVPRAGELPGGRRITAEEAALIQTFPRTMVFTGSRSSRYRQVGNAVPPLLAERVGRALAVSVFQREASSLYSSDVGVDESGVLLDPVKQLIQAF